MTTPVVPMTAVPPFPSPGDPLYNSKAFAWAMHMAGTYPAEVYALGTATYSNANEANAAAGNALAYSATAQAARDAALVAANAAPHSPVFNYAQLQAAISFNNGRTYRRKTAGASAADPQADGTNWFEANAISGMASGAVDFLKGADIASAASPNIWAAASGNYVAMTGTASVTGFTAAPQPGADRWIRAAGAFTLTNGANLIVQGGANYTCAVGDLVHIRAHTTTQFVATIFKVDGSPVGREGWVPIATATAANSASMVFTSGITSAFDEYVLDLINIVPASTGTLRLRTSSDGGATYASTAGDYFHTALYNTVSVPGPNGYAGSTETYLQVGISAGPTAAQGGLCSTVRLFAPSSTTVRKHFLMQGMSMTDNITELSSFFGTGVRTSTAAINALQLTFASGNIASGIARLYGIKKS